MKNHGTLYYVKVKVFIQWCSQTSLTFLPKLLTLFSLYISQFSSPNSPISNPNGGYLCYNVESKPQTRKGTSGSPGAMHVSLAVVQHKLSQQGCSITYDHRGVAISLLQLQTHIQNSPLKIGLQWKGAQKLINIWLS